MPGPISDTHKGTPDGAPYVPTWCYPRNTPRTCRHCGCHEGYHNDAGQCLRGATCGCPGIHPDDVTPLSEMHDG